MSVIIRIIYILFLLNFTTAFCQTEQVKLPNPNETYNEYKRRMISELNIDALFKEIQDINKENIKLDHEFEKFKSESRYMPNNSYNILIPEFYFDVNEQLDISLFKLNNQLEIELSNMLLKKELKNSGQTNNINISLYPVRYGKSFINSEPVNLEEGTKILKLADTTQASMVIWGDIVKSKKNFINVRILVTIVGSNISKLYSIEQKFSSRTLFWYDFKETIPYKAYDSSAQYKKLLTDALLFTSKLIYANQIKQKGTYLDLLTALQYFNDIRVQNPSDSYSFSDIFNEAIWAETVYLNFELARLSGNPMWFNRANTNLKEFQDLVDRWEHKIKDQTALTYLRAYSNYLNGINLDETISLLYNLYQNRKCSPVAELLLEFYIKIDNKYDAKLLLDDYLAQGNCTQSDKSRFQTRYHEVF
ncbi:MAG: hypothetical protein ACTSRG_25610 [Candidatus Helarchaeota archaeon]